jgi:uncharacterized protein (TIRG00374 family)
MGNSTMNFNIKSFFKYSIPLGAAVFLLWYVYKDTDFSSMMNDFRGADFTWIFISIIPAVVSHLSRARRWILLLEPIGYKPGLYTTFLAVMSGYFVNLLVPRMGEVSRCGVLQNTEKIPLNTSFGTVVAERAFDFIMLLLLIGLAFVIEFDTLSEFLGPLFSDKFSAMQENFARSFAILAVVVVLGVVFAGMAYYFRKKLLAIGAVVKARSFAMGMLEGIISVRKMEKKWEFLFHTLLIWFCYFWMFYLVFFAMPSTTTLGFSAGIALFVIGSLAMVAPVQGGVGAYHFMVGAGFMLYGLTKSDADAAALLMHTSQTIFVILLGGLCFFLSFLMARKNKVALADQQKVNQKETSLILNDIE